MKIAGRIFRENKIEENTENSFKACYKKRQIVVYVVKKEKGENPLFFVFVSCPKNINTVNRNIQRCTIRDAIIYALNEAGI